MRNMKLQALIFPSLITLIASSCSSPVTQAEEQVLTCLKENNAKAFSVLPKFENYLITNGYIDTWSKADLKSLIKELQNGQTKIDPTAIVADYNDELEFYSLGKFASWTACFHESTALPNDTISSVTKVAKVLTKIVYENNVGPPNDQALIDAISSEDFGEDIYQVTMLYLTWYHIRAAADDSAPE